LQELKLVICEISWCRFHINGNLLILFRIPLCLAGGQGLVGMIERGFFYLKIHFYETSTA